MDRLKNKVALVTGGGSGIGKAIALAYANEGAHVCVVGRTSANVQNTASQIEEMGQKALALKGDLAKLPEIARIVSATIDHFGAIDILVNNAGITVDLAVLDVKEEDWDNIMNIDLKAVFFTTQCVLPFMLKQGKGKIINIASPLGVEGNAYCSLYCTAKAGVINLTRALAVELATKNINVNALV